MLVNLTPHEIRILDADGNVARTVLPSGAVARCSSTVLAIGDADGVPMVMETFGNVQNLPDPKEGVWYIVSAMCKQALGRRHDCLVPSDQVRDESGRVIGCRALRI